MIPKSLTIKSLELNYETSMKKKPINYLNNDEFRHNLIEYNAKLKENPQLKIPDSIGKCFILIATNLMKCPNFYDYTYKEEMIGDGIENCVKAVSNFDETKSTNAFGYFSKICFWAALRRIKKEHKQAKVKRNIIENIDLLSDEELVSFHEDVDPRFFVDLKEFAHAYNEAYENQKGNTKEHYDNSDLAEYM